MKRNEKLGHLAAVYQTDLAIIVRGREGSTFHISHESAETEKQMNC